MKLYLFNPDSDLALANNETNYIAPVSARRMAQDLALLPVWYADPYNAVLAPSAYNADFLKQMRELFPLQVQLATEPELPDYAEAEVLPWGWEPSIRKYLLRGGVSEDRLPATQLLGEYRLLSSRLQAVAVTQHITSRYPEYTCGEHHLIENMEDCERVVNTMHTCLLKVPWSGSGKGLRWCRRGLTKSTADWCRRELVNHGALILEPIYKKEGDFAMEFYSNGRGKVLFSGYSHFITDEKGVYRGNMLVSNEDVEQWILRYIPLEAFVCIREYLQKVIEGIYGRYYSGPMGIDMMICPDQRGYPYAIYPHVEINVRMTMGMVARQLYDNFVAPGSKGIFNVDNFPSAEALRTQHEQDMRDYPLIVEEGRIVSGYLALVPVTPQSRYRAYVRVEVC